MPDMPSKEFEAMQDTETNGEFALKVLAIGETLALKEREELLSNIDKYSENFVFI